MRTLAIATEWLSLTSPCEELIKVGAEVISHRRCVTFQLAQVAVSRRMFADILLLTARLGRRPRRREGRWAK